ncbi:C-C motif chemokine 17-like [Paroedura picta]|uniref:C-C motif chemokine 17-like n=1 Tax=Paroedura picta TaxID=143630 RepID=UPI004055A167
MTALKTAVLIVLILGVFCQCIAAFYPSRSKECCYGYKKGKPLLLRQIVTYYKTPSDCSLDAVVFVMKTRRTVCADPRDPWVKRSIDILKNRK